jgi:hypothetical protein
LWHQQQQQEILIMVSIVSKLQFLYSIFQKLRINNISKFCFWMRSLIVFCCVFLRCCCVHRAMRATL